MIADALSILMDPQRWGGDSGFIMRSEQHIVLTLVVLIIGSVLAIPLGIWCAHVRPGEVIASILMNSARALPSLGLLILFGLWLGAGTYPRAHRIGVPLTVHRSLLGNNGYRRRDHRECSCHRP